MPELDSVCFTFSQANPIMELFGGLKWPPATVERAIALESTSLRWEGLQKDIHKVFTLAERDALLTTLSQPLKRQRSHSGPASPAVRRSSWEQV